MSPNAYPVPPDIERCPRSGGGRWIIVEDDQGVPHYADCPDCNATGFVTLSTLPVVESGSMT